VVSAHLLRVHETGQSQHLEMLGDGWSAHRQPLSELTHRARLLGNELKDLPAGGIG